MTGRDYQKFIARQRQARKRQADLARGRHTCPKCGKVFDRKEYLTGHMERRHG